MRFIYTKQFVIFAVLLAVSALLMFLHSTGDLRAIESAAAETPRPFIYVISGFGKGAENIFSYFSSVSLLNKTNADLKNQVIALREENALLEQYKLENNVLKQELDYRSGAPFKLVLASVVGYDTAANSDAMVIAAGMGQGVSTGDAVVAQGVLIGEISEADAYTSKVLLLTDPSVKLEAGISGTGDNGILRGDYSGITLGMISQAAQISKGQEVISAGLSGKIPSGLLIGTIGDIKSNKSDLLQSATVLSSAELSNLSLVDVIIK